MTRNNRVNGYGYPSADCQMAPISKACRRCPAGSCCFSLAGGRKVLTGLIGHVILFAIIDTVTCTSRFG